MAAQASTDLVVVLPGILGSTLYKGSTPVWKPSGGAILNALRGGLSSLRLPAGIGDNPADDGISPRGLVDDLHVIPGIWAPIKGYSPLLQRLNRLGYREPTVERPGSLLPIGYDWRLSNRHTARWIAPKIQRELGRWRSQGGQYAEAEVVFVCHSMGGLVARWYAAHDGADHTRKIITFGTPMRGSAKAVDQLVNGAPRLLGPFAGTVTAISRSLPSLHQLLPSYASVTSGPGDHTRLDPVKLPNTSTTMVADGLAFYRELEELESADPGVAEMRHPIVGVKQPTATTIRLVGGGAELLNEYGVRNYLGDGTVPLTGAIPTGLALDTNVARRVPDQHGNLQRNTAALDELEGILTASSVVIRGEQVPLGVDAPELVAAGDPLDVVVTVPPDTPVELLATLRPDDDATGHQDVVRSLRLDGDVARVRFDDLRPGSYTLTVGGAGPGSAVAPVTSSTLVWEPSAEING